MSFVPRFMDRPEDRFTQIPNDLIRSDMRPAVKVVFMFILSHRGGYPLSNARIARDVGLSRNTVAEAMRALEREGFLAREQSRTDGGQFGASVMEVWCFPAARDPKIGPREGCSKTEQAPLKNCATPAQELSTECAEIEHRRTLEKTNVEDQSEHTPSSPPPGDRFDEFWSLVPRKVGIGKARTAYRSAVKRAGDAQVVIDGMRRFANDPNLPSEKQFIPHPTTWLNGDRWEDEPLPPRQGAAPATTHTFGTRPEDWLQGLGVPEPDNVVEGEVVSWPEIEH